MSPKPGQATVSWSSRLRFAPVSAGRVLRPGMLNPSDPSSLASLRTRGDLSATSCTRVAAAGDGPRH